MSTRDPSLLDWRIGLSESDRAMRMYKQSELEHRRSSEGRGPVARLADGVMALLGDPEAQRRRRVDSRPDGGSAVRERDLPMRVLADPASSMRTRGPKGEPDLLRVCDVMTGDVRTVGPDDTIEYAARLMRDVDCGALPVLDETGRVVAMVTDRDIVCRLVASAADARSATVRDCMSEEVFSCAHDEPVAACLRTMSERRVRRVPIVDERERLVGIVSLGDLAEYAGEHIGSGERRATAEVLSAISKPTRRPAR